MNDDFERYEKEVAQISNATLEAAERHYSAETPWFVSVYWLGIPSTILSAVAGGAAFSDIQHYQAVMGCISIAAAILASVMTFLGPSEKARLHHTMAKSYEAIYNECGYFLRVEVHENGQDPKLLRKKLDEIFIKFNKLNQTSPAIPGYAYRAAARKRLTGKGEVVRADGLDVPSMNPPP